MCMFCRSLFVLLYFFFWPLCRLSFFDLCCLFFFDLRILITPLVSLNSSYIYTFLLWCSVCSQVCVIFYVLIYVRNKQNGKKSNTPLDQFQNLIETDAKSIGCFRSQARGGCSICWYWCNCWSLQLKLSFYNPNTAYTYPFTFLAWYVHSNKRWQD